MEELSDRVGVNVINGVQMIWSGPAWKACHRYTADPAPGASGKFSLTGLAALVVGDATEPDHPLAKPCVPASLPSMQGNEDLRAGGSHADGRQCAVSSPGRSGG